MSNYATDPCEHLNIGDGINLYYTFLRSSGQYSFPLTQRKINEKLLSEVHAKNDRQSVKIVEHSVRTDRRTDDFF